MPIADWSFWLALAVMVIGLAGVLLPGLPGLGLIWLAALIYALAERFATVGPLTLVALTALAGAGMAADYLLGQVVGKAAGASWQALLAGIAGGAVGFVVGLLIGALGALPAGLIGTLVGVVLVEYRRRNDLRAAAKAGAGWLAGCLIGRGLQFAIGVAMILIFAWQAGWRGAG